MEVIALLSDRNEETKKLLTIETIPLLRVSKVLNDVIKAVYSVEIKEENLNFEIELSKVKIDLSEEKVIVEESVDLKEIEEVNPFLVELLELDEIFENFFFQTVEIPYTEISLLNYYIGIEEFISFLFERKIKRKVLKNLKNFSKVEKINVEYFTYASRQHSRNKEFFRHTNKFLSLSYPFIEEILGGLFQRKNFVREVQAYIFEKLTIKIFRMLKKENVLKSL